MIILRECPHCGGIGEMIVRNPRCYGSRGAFVKCRSCKAQSGWSDICDAHGNVTEESMERGKRNAAREWNRRVR